MPIVSDLTAHTAYWRGGAHAPSSGIVSATFDAAGVEALVRWAKANGPDYGYPGFC